MAMEAKRWSKMEKRCAKLIKKFGGISLTRIDPDDICCLKVYGAAKADWYARIRIISFPYSSLLDHTYLIEFNFDSISDYCKNKKQLKNALILIAYHELMHINKKGKIRKHDIQDFHHILSMFGIESDRYREAPNLLKIDISQLKKQNKKKEN